MLGFWPVGSRPVASGSVPTGGGAAYTLTCMTGTFTLSGQAAIPRRAAKAVATPGAFTLSGVAAILKQSRGVGAGVGAFTLSGQAIAFKADRKLVASAGAFTLTGVAAGVRKGRVMAAAAGAFTLTGQSAGFFRALKLVAVKGTFTLTGVAMTPRAARRIAISAGAFTLTGKAATLRQAFGLGGGTGAFTLTGQAAAMRAARKLLAGTGAFTLAGIVVDLHKTTGALEAETGVFVLAGGNAVLFRRSRSALRGIAYPQESDEAEIVLVDIDHEDLPDGPIYLTDAGGAYDAGLDTYFFDVAGRTYIAAPIDVLPPDETDQEPRGRLVVPNVDQRIGEAIESIHSPATVTVTIVLESDPTVVLGGPYQALELRAVRGDAQTIEGDLLWPSQDDSPFPKDTIRPSKYRAAFRALA